MARQKKPEEHGHSESWLVSYCDMISLLVTFFLMMMTFSTKDNMTFKEASLGLLRGRGGIWKNPDCSSRRRTRSIRRSRCSPRKSPR